MIPPAGESAPGREDLRRMAEEDPTEPPMPRSGRELGSMLLRWLWGLLVFGVPALLLSALLQQLGGAALWIPESWRVAVYVLVVGAGMAVFQLARKHKAALERRGPQGKRRALLCALAGFGGALVLAFPHLWLRVHCVMAWYPDDAVVRNEYGDPDRPEEPIDLSGVEAPVRLERHGSGYAGTVLVPLRRWLSARMQEEITNREAYYGQPGLRAFLDEDPILFIDALREEREAMAKTIALFLAVHALLMLAASAGYGYAFTSQEELAQKLVG